MFGVKTGISIILTPAATSKLIRKYNAQSKVNRGQLTSLNTLENRGHVCHLDTYINPKSQFFSDPCAKSTTPCSLWQQMVLLSNPSIFCKCQKPCSCHGFNYRLNQIGVQCFHLSTIAKNWGRKVARSGNIMSLFSKPICDQTPLVIL